MTRTPLAWVVGPWREALLTELISAGVDAGLLMDDLCDQAAELMPLESWRVPCRQLAQAVRRGDEVWQQDQPWQAAGLSAQGGQCSASRV